MLKVSIITPVFNAEKTIERTINSVLNQSYPEIEYIIIDGASQDGTLKILDKYRNRVSKIISEPDRGIADAYNKGIKLATGTLIGIVAADDVLLPNAIVRLINKYDGVSDVVAGSMIMKEKEDGYRLFRSNADLDCLNFSTSLMHPSTYITKTAYECYGYYDLTYKYAMDRELLLRFYKEGATFQVIDEVISLFSAGGVSNRYQYMHGFIEDFNISICYKVPRLSTFVFYINRVIKSFIRTLLEKTNTWKYVYKYRSIVFMTEKELQEYITEVCIV